MDASQAAVLATLRNVETFLVDKKEELAGVELDVITKKVTDVVVRFTSQSVDQNAGRSHEMSETSRQKQLRDDLRVGHMKPIAEVARDTLHESPELKPFLLPKLNMSSTRLVAYAASMAEQAANYEQVLIQGGLPHDFIVQLTAATNALTESLVSRSQGKTRTRGATTAIAPLVTRARGLIRILDTLLNSKLRDNQRLLGEWKAVKKIPRKPGPTRNTGAPTSASVPSSSPVSAGTSAA